MSINPPPPSCSECDAEMPDVDGDHFACYYTGRACESGCDCPKPGPLLCDDCTFEAEEAERLAEANAPHDINNCTCDTCDEDRAERAHDREDR